MMNRFKSDLLSHRPRCRGADPSGSPTPGVQLPHGSRFPASAPLAASVRPPQRRSAVPAGGQLSRPMNGKLSLPLQARLAPDEPLARPNVGDDLLTRSITQGSGMGEPVRSRQGISSKSAYGILSDTRLFLPSTCRSGASFGCQSPEVNNPADISGQNAPASGIKQEKGLILMW